MAMMTCGASGVFPASVENTTQVNKIIRIFEIEIQQVEMQATRPSIIVSPIEESHSTAGKADADGPLPAC
jgi:hypothetical protein